MRKRSDYTEEEIDAVIDAAGLRFMRNRIKASDSHVVELMSTSLGATLVARMRSRGLLALLLEVLTRRWS